MKQEAYVDFCTTLDMIRDYFTRALQGSQFRLFSNIILGIHEYYIPPYDSYVRELLKEQNVKL